MTAHTQTVLPVAPAVDAPEAPEPISTVPAIMLTAFVVLAVGLTGIGVYATFHDQPRVGVATTIGTLLALSAYQSWVIARQRRTISHLTLSVDGLLGVTGAPATQVNAGEERS